MHRMLNWKPQCASFCRALSLSLYRKHSNKVKLLAEIDDSTVNTSELIFQWLAEEFGDKTNRAEKPDVVSEIHCPAPAPKTPSEDTISDEKQLNSTWALLYSDVITKKKTQIDQDNFSDDLACVFKCGTITEFFRALNHVKTPTQLRYKNSPTYYFFRDGIKPEWEHPSNLNGGMLRIIFKQHERSQYLDSFWIEMLLAVVGEQLPHSNLITGLILQRRNKEDRLCLWLKMTTYDERMEIEAAVLRVLNMAEGSCIPFLLHCEHKQNVRCRQENNIDSSNDNPWIKVR